MQVSVLVSLRDRLMVGAALMALPLSACAASDDDEEPPQLLSGEFLTQTWLRLQFSEPLASVEEVDPTNFRLSLALNEGDYTHYYDLSNHFDGTDPEAGDAAADGRSFRHALTEFVRIEFGPDESTLELELSDQLDHAGACDAIDMAEGEAGLFVHYSDFYLPHVTDRAGNPLEDIADHWVRGNAMATVPGQLEFLDAAPQIPCLRAG